MSQVHPLPSVEDLLSVISYDPLTGVMVWMPREIGKYETPKMSKAFNTLRAGKDATCSTGRYRGVSTPWGRFQAHRIAYKIATGKEPNVIDHIDGNGFNNRLANLRSVTTSENLKNRALGTNSTSGYTGVCWCPQRKLWRCHIKLAGKQKSLGLYRAKEDAVEARRVAERENGFSPVTRVAQA